jgi:hypothetical protein
VPAYDPVSYLGMKVENLFPVVPVEHGEAKRLFQYRDEVAGFRQWTKYGRVGARVDASPWHEHEPRRRLDIFARWILTGGDQFIPAQPVGKPHVIL